MQSTMLLLINSAIVLAIIIVGYQLRELRKQITRCNTMIKHMMDMSKVAKETWEYVARRSSES